MLGQWTWWDNGAVLFYALLIAGGLGVFFWAVFAGSIGIMRSFGDMLGGTGRLIVLLMVIGLIYVVWSVGKMPVTPTTTMPATVVAIPPLPQGVSLPHNTMTPKELDAHDAGEMT